MKKLASIKKYSFGFMVPKKSERSKNSLTDDAKAVAGTLYNLPHELKHEYSNFNPWRQNVWSGKGGLIADTNMGAEGNLRRLGGFTGEVTGSGGGAIVGGVGGASIGGVPGAVAGSSILGYQGGRILRGAGEWGLGEVGREIDRWTGLGGMEGDLEGRDGYYPKGYVPDFTPGAKNLEPTFFSHRSNWDYLNGIPIVGGAALTATPLRKSFVKGFTKHQAAVEAAEQTSKVPKVPKIEGYPIPEDLRRGMTLADVQEFQKGNFPPSAYRVDPDYAANPAFRERVIPYDEIKEMHQAAKELYPPGVRNSPYDRTYQPMAVEFNEYPHAQDFDAMADEIEGLISQSSKSKAVHVHEVAHPIQSEAEKNLIPDISSKYHDTYARYGLEPNEMPQHLDHYAFTRENALGTLPFEQGADDIGYGILKRMQQNSTTADAVTKAKIQSEVNAARCKAWKGDNVKNYTAPAQKEFAQMAVDNPHGAAEYLGTKAHELLTNTLQSGHKRSTPHIDQFKRLANGPIDGLKGGHAALLEGKDRITGLLSIPRWLTAGAIADDAIGQPIIGKPLSIGAYNWANNWMFPQGKPPEERTTIVSPPKTP
jgi:hypothetical protein